MRKATCLRVLAGAAFALALSAFPVIAQVTAPGDDPVAAAFPPEGHKVSDPGRLIEMVLGDDAAELQETLADLQDDMAAAQSDLDAARAEVDAVQAQQDAARLAFGTEEAAVRELVARLSPEQIIALNRSLDNALDRKLPVTLDSPHLQALLDGDYNSAQINILTRALRAEARFLLKADETGDDRFLEQAEMQKDKFLARIERFDGRVDTSDAAKGAIRLDIQTATQQSATEAAR